MWHTRKARIAAMAATVLVLAAALVAIVLTRHHGGSSTPAAAPPPLRTAPSTTTPGTPPGQPGAIIVKIDNVSGARPQTGLSAAQVIYVEPVEAGLSRLAAVFTGPLPPRVGPVRSSRETDIDLLAQWGRPSFAYSGAVPELVARLHATAWLVNASQSDVPGAYQRDHSRPAPHNLYVFPSRLPNGVGASQPVLEYGAAPAGGAPAADRQVRYPAARYDFHWSAAANRWLVSLDGTSLTSTESGQLGAATVVLQQVRTTPGTYREDTSGNRAPIAQTVGSGPVTVLRDGLAFDGTWSRPTAADPTRFQTVSGLPLPVAAGPVWIVLVPA